LIAGVQKPAQEPTIAVVAEQSPDASALTSECRREFQGLTQGGTPPSPSPFEVRAITSQAIYKDAGDDAMTTRLRLLRCKIRIGMNMAGISPAFRLPRTKTV